MKRFQTRFKVLEISVTLDGIPTYLIGEGVVDWADERRWFLIRKVEENAEFAGEILGVYADADTFYYNMDAETRVLLGEVNSYKVIHPKSNKRVIIACEQSFNDAIEKGWRQAKKEFNRVAKARGKNMKWEEFGVDVYEALRIAKDKLSSSKKVISTFHRLHKSELNSERWRDFLKRLCDDFDITVDSLSKDLYAEELVR